ncbi:AraC family transcriptional regulator [Flavobacterium gelatinilyticum]|uniref:AraC family transcriptional regulator n=1 Tax=Flavobacterium gelatinilyticum TaxID=3003260 RepID=UPI002481477E|nr:AraC family transcriptional regulator [Flavobacterium gelatinilyticum]
MQNVKIKCGLLEKSRGEYHDDIQAEAYIWSEENWKHDDYEHSHERHQLTYVEEGYQYFHIGKKIYLVPQYHVIWIPSKITHQITSDAREVNLRLILFKSAPDEDFYNDVHVFAAPAVLKEMLQYASRWNKVVTENTSQMSFLKAMLNNLPYFCDENSSLQIPVPYDARLMPVCSFIRLHYQQNLNPEELAERALMSVRSLQRIFKNETGLTLQKYAQLIRILKSIELIDSGQYTLSQIAVMIGYKSLAAFTSSYFAITKTKPKLKK